MRKYSIGVVGFFANGESKAGGQEAKTWSLTRAFEENFGKSNIYTADTLNWKKNPLGLLFRLIYMACTCSHVFMLPAQNSVRIFVPLFVFLRVFCRCRIHYAVVGGWLPDRIRNQKFLAGFARKLDGIYVETSTMKHALEAQGFENVVVIPNFKYITPLKKEELATQYRQPYELCTFSRVMKEKGIEDAIEAVDAVNKKYGSVVLKLDIYGKIDPGYEERFEEIKERLPQAVRYCGMVEPDESVSILRNYFALLFPTHYNTEGVPGTIIDAYAAGVPVVTALWQNSPDVFVEGKTGWGYTFSDQDAFVKCLERMVREPEVFMDMKKTALDHAQNYMPANVIKRIIEIMNK